jgi:hypothetical protein
LVLYFHISGQGGEPIICENDETAIAENRARSIIFFIN